MTGAEVVWVTAAILAAAAQTLRNTLQSSLTASLGALGATLVRFLYGLPFGLLFLAGTLTVAGPLPAPTPAFALWLATGAFAQIAATALMLAAMRERAFVVVTVYTKTELVQAALFGAVLLGDAIGSGGTLSVVVASLGVLLASWPAGLRDRRDLGAFRPALFGLLAGGLFALAAIGYRGATLALGDGPVAPRAAFTLACALALQTVAMVLWFLWRDRATLRAVMLAWRPSLLAGFTGAFASLGWFVAFALTTAANVKMVGLIEIAFAWIISRRVFRQGILVRELLGMALIVGAIVFTLAL